MGLPFHLHCLGRPQLISPNGEPVRIRVRKHLALLVYLALEPRGQHRRERMADLLWPNVSPSDGRHSVATAISMLRGKLGRELVHGDRDHVQLIGSGLAVDLDRLAAGKILGDELVPALEIGGFLEDFDVPDATEFMMWRERQRARWLPLVRDALVLLIDRCRRTGDFRRIEQLGNSLLEIDELSEDGIRAKMEARAFDGDRVTALKVFQSWKSKLASELDAVPSALVEGMAIRLRQRGWETAPVTSIPTVPTDQWRGRSFIGRGPEYETLYNAWESTCATIPRHVLVLGDSGVGKSTLLERVVTAAGLEGAAISRVQCYELEREIPYAAVGSLIEGLLDRPGASGTAPEWLAELARTVPQVRQRFPGIPEAMDTQGETARIRLTEALQQLAMAIAEEHPVILVLDDVHLADDASLAVLHLMMRRTLDKRVMVLMAARTGELGQSPHAVRLREGHEHFRIIPIDLQPLNGEESGMFLDNLLADCKAQPQQSVRRALLESAVGYPMVLEYLVKDWEANGEGCLALSIGAMTEELLVNCVPSQAYHLILTRMAHGLEPTVRNVLSMAAVLGSRLNDIDLYELADVSVGQTMMGLGRLTDLRVLRDGGHRLDFSNELIRGEAYLSVPSSVRRTLHRNIAQQLLENANRGQSIPGLEIAWHLTRAGQSASATPHLLRGAREAMLRGAPHEAERGLSTAMGHLKEPDRTDATLLLAEAFHEQGNWAAVLSILEGCSIDSADKRTNLKAVLAAEPQRRLGLIREGDEKQVIDRLLSIADLDTVSMRARIRALSNAAYLVVDLDPGPLSALSHAVSSFRWDDLEDDDLPHLAVTQAILHYNLRENDAARTVLREAIARLQGKNVANLGTISLFIALGNVHSSAGQYEEALCQYQKGYQLAMRIGNDAALGRIGGNNAMCTMRLGRLDEVADWAAIGLAKGDLYDCSKTLYHHAVALLMLGKVSEAQTQVAELLTIPGKTNNSRIKQNCFLFSADILQLTGHTQRALDVARYGLGPELARLHSSNTAGIFSRWLARSRTRTSGENPLITVRELLQRKKLDRLDVVEVLCANLRLETDPASKEEILGRLQRETREVPSAALEVLRRLGEL